ncbi:hypothetical protein NP233_g1178 [Leucocoprinus birnbaumii]|uniref:Protein kinase domain-containing protein n=1 Tax=Leucocoprinus birnbaumii TaxID=56174 RepID=A0AAD5W0E7_9AGAR|nr:hypothetical protein NP233_g1178 [Leucocoprinus birnbaumii]
MASLPLELSQESYTDLSGRIRHDRNGDPDHCGGYSDVYIGYLTDEETGNETKVDRRLARAFQITDKNLKVAIKVLRITNDSKNVEKVKKYVIRETVTWSEIDHENVLEFFGIADDLGRYGCPALVSPYCNKGTVSNYLTPNSSRQVRLDIIMGVCKGLKYLHEKKVIHGDLKPSNVLVHDDGRALLCDFGRSKILNTGGFTTRPSGVVRYQAPEIQNGGGLSKATDVYALGITSFEIWTGETPWKDLKDGQIIIAILVRNERPVRPVSAPSGTELVWNVLEHCWTLEPEKRLSMTEVVQKVQDVDAVLFLSSPRPRDDLAN